MSHLCNAIQALRLGCDEELVAGRSVRLLWLTKDILHLQVDMMEELGLEVKVIDSRWGEGANEEKLAQALKVCVAACTPFVMITVCMVI